MKTQKRERSGGTATAEGEGRLREALAKIAEVASAAVNGGEYSGNGYEHEEGSVDVPPEVEAGCTIKQLPQRLWVRASEVAAEINPVNAPAFGQLAAAGVEIPSEPLSIAVLTSKYWGPAPRRLTVSFMESTPANVRARIVQNLNAWSCGVQFVETSGTGIVRISRGSGGYWSYLGTDVSLIPRNRPTMNLQGFSMSTPDSEYRRVVRHEGGHTLGFPHEHMRRDLIARLDREKTYDYFWRTQGWDRRMVDQQVLTPLEERALISTSADQTSIMCYRLPGSITIDGRPIAGGPDINRTDLAFAGRIYPRPGRDLVSELQEEDWDASEDVEDPTELLSAA